jgi:hypothetical protein
MTDEKEVRVAGDVFPGQGKCHGFKYNTGKTDVFGWSRDMTIETMWANGGPTLTEILCEFENRFYIVQNAALRSVEVPTHWTDNSARSVVCVSMKGVREFRSLDAATFTFEIEAVDKTKWKSKWR